MIKLEAGAATDVGQVRSNNQDRYLVSAPIFAVADGMGGHLGGEVASKIATDVLESAAQSNNVHSKSDLINATILANQQIYKNAQEDESVHGMGTTLTAVALIKEESENRLAVVNIGDSRTYLMRDHELQQLTTDHSLVEDLLRAGQITPQEAEIHPRRNMLTRALGVEPAVEPDLLEVLPLRGDRFLLCSDGLVRELTDDQIAAVLRRLADPTEAARDLVARAKEAGGADNITVVVVDVVDDDDQARLAAEKNKHDPIIPTEMPQPKPPKVKPKVTPDKEQPASSHTAPLITIRVVIFIVALLLVIGLAVIGVTSYANNAYYVSVSGKSVAIYKGRPDGILWVNPSLNQVTSLKLKDVPPSRRADLVDGHSVNSLQAAKDYVSNLREEAIDLGIIPTSTTSTSVKDSK